MEDVLQLTHNGAIAEIRFNRPAVLNAPNVEVAERFELSVTEVTASPRCRVLVLSGAGRAFMAGGDLRAFSAAQSFERPQLSYRIIAPFHRALEALSSSHLISIAAVHGAVAGAGMSLSMMTDLAVAADSAKFNFAYTKIAAGPDLGGSFALPRLLGLRRALDVALLSETLDARAALQLGLVNRVVPDAELRSVTLDLAQRLSRGPRESLELTRKLLRQSFASTLPTQLRAELESFQGLSSSLDFQEGLDAFFEKRAARYGD
jgi:2-(1,2-epoxy-1,2-dihydrophenyl)acetyl-CoA isomerase